LEHGTIPHFKLVYDMVLLLFESKRMRSHELNNNIVIDTLVSICVCRRSISFVREFRQ